MPREIKSWKWIALSGGVLASILFYLMFYRLTGDTRLAGMASTVALMGFWWITQAMPLAMTSLVPIVAYPLFNIRSTGETASSYMNPLIMLFIGGFLIAVAMQRWNLHKRIALHIISILGGRPAGLVLGFMVASALLSMWISNTATAMMMVTIGLAVVAQIEETCKDKERLHLELCIMLSIAYGCSAGGVGTVIGTPTNLVFISLQRELFPEIEPMTFGSWIILGIPLSAGLVAILWFLLTQVFYRKIRTVRLEPGYFEDQIRALSPLSAAEKRVLAVFVTTGLLWIFRKPIIIGEIAIPGWSSLWTPFTRIDDGVVAIFMAGLLFMIPAKSEGRRLLEEDAFLKIPWDILLLFSGGFALAGGFIESGFSQYLAESFSALAGFPPLLLLVIICLGISFMTEFTSNTATAAMILPVLGALAPNLGVHPFLIMIPATIAASMAFMMPVATPPNAIVFSSGKVTVPQMAKIGFVLNLVTCIWVVVLCQIMLPHILPGQ